MVTKSVGRSKNPEGVGREAGLRTNSNPMAFEGEGLTVSSVKNGTLGAPVPTDLITMHVTKNISGWHLTKAAFFMARVHTI